MSEVQPIELAQLLDAGERPRLEGWSLRAALTRYAQPQPQRASDVIELLRRLEVALRPHAKRLESDGRAIWDAVAERAPAHDADGLVEVLRVFVELDRVGDDIAAWAVDRTVQRPDAVVDAAVPALAARLDDLGVPREERQGRPPSGRRG